MIRVLLIEDDIDLGETIRDYLELNQIETVYVHDERKIPEMLSSFEFDVIVLDLMLRSISGEKIISKLRELNITVPILVVTAKRGIETKEVCFSLGADDYLTKPFDFKELLLRIRALSKRRHIENLVRIGDLIVNLDAKTIQSQDGELKLSKTAWQLLTLLIKKRGEIVDIDTILNYVWPNRDVGEEIVRAYIKELRKILPPDSIKTYPGRGYRLL